jgi:hypothetical protein
MTMRSFTSCVKSGPRSRSRQIPASAGARSPCISCPSPVRVRTCVPASGSQRYATFSGSASTHSSGSSSGRCGSVTTARSLPLRPKALLASRTAASPPCSTTRAGEATDQVSGGSARLGT